MRAGRYPHHTSCSHNADAALLLSCSCLLCSCMATANRPAVHVNHVGEKAAFLSANRTLPGVHHRAGRSWQAAAGIRQAWREGAGALLQHQREPPGVRCRGDGHADCCHLCYVRVALQSHAHCRVMQVHCFCAGTSEQEVFSTRHNALTRINPAAPSYLLAQQSPATAVLPLMQVDQGHRGVHSRQQGGLPHHC